MCLNEKNAAPWSDLTTFEKAFHKLLAIALVSGCLVGVIMSMWILIANGHILGAQLCHDIRECERTAFR